MNADQLIDSYVADVARRLPRRQRADVAAELRSILLDELGDRTDPDAARRVVDAFGRPAEAAARYRPPLVLLDPADSRPFLRWSLIGLAVIWALGAASVAQEPGPNPVASWWLGVVIPSLWWPGVLFTGFAVGAYTRRRWPERARWRPRPADTGHVNRWGHAAAWVFYVGGTIALVTLPWLHYDPAFHARRGPWVLALLIVHLVLYAVVIAQGRWNSLTRRLDIGLNLLVGGVLVWAMAAGAVFVEAWVDDLVKFVVIVILLVTAFDVVQKTRRELRQHGLSSST
ncbi:hypothetical protein FDA94_10175 [Herbidospora galbida]|uniref:Uncharacterized protein n=1 Tax=Herbidospora galbida TaxID=2575442 RepID=A0A4U3MIY5_9ACTN|nr:hypothetical protein [Herbidospora galbida]TKK89291.1 hypothetical protein FDA94_10175 [Herbidospora galbida]